jgi:hypothetical protein
MNVGVRDLTMQGSGATPDEGVGLFNCYGCWVKGVTVLNSHQMGVYCWQCVHAEVSNSYFYNYGRGGTARPFDPTGVKYQGADDYIANNIFQKGSPCTMAEGPADGTVVAYNFCINSDTETDSAFGGTEQHSAGDDYELYEGNMAYEQIADQNHGTHLAETFYRNFYTGWESCASGNCGSGNTAKISETFGIGVLGYNRYANMVANVLGTAGYTTTYTWTQANWDANFSAFALGSGNTAVSPTVPFDSVAVSTSYRWGNWDNVNAATQFNTTEVPTAISGFPQSVPTSSCTASLSCPASFYYPSRPAWYFSATPFPAIGPDVTWGNVGQCSGTLNTSGKFSGMPTTDGTKCGSGNTKNTAWGGHVNAVPAMQAYLHFGGNLDGTSAALTTFDESYYASSSPISTTTSLSPSNFTPAAGTNITLTATVTPSSGPTGAVGFFDGVSSIGTGTVTSGTATRTVTAITGGTHTYTAIYGGDGSYSSSSSSSVTVTASGGGPPSPPSGFSGRMVLQ